MARRPDKPGGTRSDKTARAGRAPSVGTTSTARGAKRHAVPPRIKHGTRVAFNITCATCGREDTLPFVPKNTDELLCSSCARERFGDDWDKGRGPRPAEFEFDCAACGAHDVVPFVPEDPTAPMLCAMCVQGIEKPVRGRVDGEIIDSRAGVRKRRG